ncbi:GAF domain-containing protein [Nostoc sp. FACHB-888]|uniref:GAF domain-containing protein n=1 Tax=Nostoc sp. FACHB-888 TaxID=2692842 RepID=UPI001684443E|nr:GAF domain-containing protein [Nostoc sp. FACHB-888]MBD2246946.1 GAF domain-containing protein [Nostoc sp. FACHB-888]
MSTLRFILLEDNPVDAELVQAMLLDGKIDHELQRVDTGADFQTALLSDEFDLILADYALADFDGINALEIARRLRPDTPFIFISGSLAEELAIAAIKQGATDYVLKQRLGRLVPSVQRALQEVPEDKDIIDRKQALSAIESDLKDTQLLHELSARLVIEGDIQTLYQEIVAAAIALTRADAGSIQILDEATQELVMLANQGAGQKLTEHFYRVNAGSNTPCGIALTTGKRTFVDFDVPESEDPHGSMRLHREEGYLSAQSTPLITRSGKAIGMFSTHWCKHHRPSDREVRFLDLLARQAADLIEQRQAQVALRESEAKYRSLFESMNEGLAINELVRDESGCAVDARYLELNPAYERQTGFDRSSTLGRLASEVFPNYYRSWLEIVERVVRTGQPERFEHFVPDNDKWFVFQVTPFVGADGFSVLYDDITERKRREANLVFLASIENEFANLTLSSEIANVAGDRIAAHFNLSHCLLVEIDEQETVARVFHDHKAADLPSLVGDYVIQDFHTQAEAEQLAAGQPLVSTTL